MNHIDILPIILSYLDVPSKVCSLNTCKLFATIIGNTVKSQKDLCNLAAEYGHLEILKWARDNGCSWSSSTCYYAALNGHLEVLKWARSQNPQCEWDRYTCSNAASINGHLEILKWLRSKDRGEGGEVCPWNEFTRICAESNGHLELVKWLRENGCS